MAGVRMKRYSFPFLAMLLLMSGCVYYNTFFLAKKNFKDAESARKKAGQEIVKGGASNQYQKTIEKASVILEFHPNSKYVDDALYLIGRSFYHLGEFSKAETKFRELLVTYPESKFADESLLYLGKSRFWKEDYVGARDAFEKVDSTAEDKELRSEATFMLGEILYFQEEWSRSISVFEEYLKQYGKGGRSGETKFKIANAYYGQENYSSAKDAFLAVQDLNADDTLKYQALVAAGDCFYLEGEADSGLAIFTKLADDEKNYDKMANLYLELARGEELRGNHEVAMETYRKLIDEFPRTVESAIAYFQLGNIYQSQLFDLDTAKAMYDSSTAVKGNSPVAKTAFSRSADIAKLGSYRTGKTAEAVDVAIESQYFLAELYLTQLDQPDSALSEYHALLDSFPDCKYAPNALLAIGWVMENIREDTAAAQEYYRRVLEEYPNSDLVVDAMERLGIDPGTTDYDYPARRYREAERLLFDERDYRAADELFQSIIDDFPESEFAPKASWAKAWALSNFHNIAAPDSSDSGEIIIDSTYILAYQKVTELYGSTDYGQSAATVLGGHGVGRPRTRPQAEETIKDTSTAGELIEVDSLAILDSIAKAIDDEIRQLEPAPENPTLPAFEFPFSAYNIPIEELLMVSFKVKINFIGEVTEYVILASSGYEDIDRAAKEMIKDAVFDVTKIDPQFYDNWFYYEFYVPKRTE
jgi:TolA-binding protein